MKKSDLNNFDLIEFSNGHIYLCIDNNFYDPNGYEIDGWSLDDYNDDLTTEDKTEIDYNIIKVWKHKPEANCIVFNVNNRTPDWQRELASGNSTTTTTDTERDDITSTKDEIKGSVYDVLYWKEENKLNRKLYKRFNKILKLHQKLTDLYNSGTFDNTEKIESLNVKIERHLDKSLNLRNQLADIKNPKLNNRNDE